MKSETTATLNQLDAILTDKNSKLSMDEDEHLYTLDGNVVLPSVTQVMKPISVIEYGGVNEYFMSVAAERGTRIHSATEFFDKYGYETADEETQPYLDAYKAWRTEKPDRKPIMHEQTLYSPSMMYAGMFDFISADNGLWDKKTTADVHYGMWAVQLAAYDKMLTEQTGHKVDYAGVLRLSRYGTYQEIIYSREDLEKHFFYFMCCLHLRKLLKS